MHLFRDKDVPKASVPLQIVPRCTRIRCKSSKRTTTTIDSRTSFSRRCSRRSTGGRRITPSGDFPGKVDLISTRDAIDGRPRDPTALQGADLMDGPELGIIKDTNL